MYVMSLENVGKELSTSQTREGFEPRERLILRRSLLQLPPCRFARHCVPRCTGAEGFELQLTLPARFAAREVPATSRSLTLT